jgi:hypothetical protein
MKTTFKTGYVSRYEEEWKKKHSTMCHEAESKMSAINFQFYVCEMKSLHKQRVIDIQNDLPNIEEK